MTLNITSLQNPKIRYLLSLSKSKNRKKEGQFIIEGLREISRAKATGVTFAQIYYCPEIMSGEALSVLKEIGGETSGIILARNVFNRVVYREDAEGILVVAQAEDKKLEDLHPSKDSLFLVLETVEKPGNLGAVVRTADAAGITAVIICDPQTDIYNPNVIRSSLGCLFSTEVIVSDSESAIAFLKSRGVKIFAAALQDSVNYTTGNYCGPTAFIMGSEADGLSAIWRENADRIIKIPMAGIADSLNVSVSAAVLVFEALRQRNI